MVDPSPTGLHGATERAGTSSSHDVPASGGNKSSEPVPPARLHAVPPVKHFNRHKMAGMQKLAGPVTPHADVRHVDIAPNNDLATNGAPIPVAMVAPTAITGQQRYISMPLYHILFY